MYLSWIANGVGLTFNVSFLLLALLVPIDALKMGLSSTTVGILTAIPGVLQLPTRIISGPLTDVLGERAVLLMTFGLGIIAGLCAGMVLPQILGLALAQLTVGAARGIFWPAAQSFASRLPGNRVQNLGTFTSFTKGGALIGIAIAGGAAVALGIRAAFLGSSALSLLCFLIACRFPRWPPNQSDGGWNRAFKGILPAVRRPFVVNNGLLAFLTAVPQALAQSFYPILLIRDGLSDQWASVLTAAQSLGMIIAGLLAAFLVRKLGSKRFALGSCILLVVAFVLTASKPLVWIGIAIFMAGLASGWLNVVFLNLVVRLSDDAERGTNLGMAQGYFVIAMMGTPALTGLVSSQIGLSDAFIWIGGGALIITVLVAVLWRWAFGGPKIGLHRGLGA